MKWRGRVRSYIEERLRSYGALHFSLIDPGKVSDLDQVLKLSEELAEAGTDAFLIGGSIAVSESMVDEIAKTLEEVGLPTILFPGNVSGLSKFADAILFMSLLNSEDPYFIIGAQMLAAPLVKKYGLEVLPTAYIIVGYGGAAGHVGRARPIPYEKYEIASAYALAAELIGMEYVYLEAGSGAPRSIPPEMVSSIKEATSSIKLIVGGGIRDVETAIELVRKGADIIVTGTIIEEKPEHATRLVKEFKRSVRSIKKV